MVNFDFITDEALRKSLESDLQELAACYAAGAWKAVHVLAGSIIEATLIDYLVASGKLDAPSAFKKELAPLIDMCKAESILSNKAVDLSTVVRTYRNLIHPGRALRLSESVDEPSASIAKAVIEILVAEVSNRKRQTYGYTAEQVVRKVEQDKSALSIADHLLRETPDVERRRLVLKVLPDAYLNCRSVDDDEVTWSFGQRLQKLYRVALDAAGPDLRLEAASKYVSVLKEGSDLTVQSYELGLFRGSDIEYVVGEERPLVVAHLQGTLKHNLTSEVLQAAQGITQHLHGELLEQFLETLALSILASNITVDLGHPGIAFLFDEPTTDTDELGSAIKSLQERYKWRPHVSQVLAVMKDAVDIPF